MTRFFFASLLAATIASSLTGCYTIPEAKVFSETGQSSEAVPVKKALVVIDISLEYDELPGGAVFSKDDNAKKMYGPIAQAMVDQIKAAGGNAEFIIHTSNASFSIPTEYSHAWVKRLTRMTHTRNSHGSFVSERIWDSRIIQKLEKSQSTITLFRSQYESDAPRCFMVNTFLNGEECKQKYISLLTQQWRKSGLALP